nr:hypothetical protein [Clostridia bacterium]
MYCLLLYNLFLFFIDIILLICYNQFMQFPVKHGTQTSALLSAGNQKHYIITEEKMKKLISCILLLSMLFAAAACSG